MYEFIGDLDEYFCEKYANYDKLCSLPGYKMPLMQTSSVDEFGRTRAYTLPADTLRLALQENKTALLAALKERIADATFSFSFVPQSLFAQLRGKFSKYGFYKNFKELASRMNIDLAETGTHLNVSEEIWQAICKGKFLPTKNLIFSFALVAHLSLSDMEALLALADYEMDYAVVKDVVVSYLLHNKIYNREMIEAALREYKVENLFLL